MAALHDLSALEQAAAVRHREVSPSELVEHYLDRIATWSDAVGAYVTVTADLAREQARQAERTLRAADADDLPPLLGVPIAIKDLTDVAGVRCTLGSAAFADRVATVDAHVVTLLRNAGTVILGKSNAAEFGAPCYTEPDVAPPARTPGDRWPRACAGESVSSAPGTRRPSACAAAQCSSRPPWTRYRASMCASPRGAFSCGFQLGSLRSAT